MKKAANLYCCGFSIAVLAQLSIMVVYHYLLCTIYEHSEKLMVFFKDYLFPLIIGSVIIAFVLLPVEALMMKTYARRTKKLNREDGVSSESFKRQEQKIIKCLRIIGVLVFVCASIHFLVDLIIIEGRWGLKHGSDEYMVFVLPGAVFSFLPVIGIIISDAILFGTQKETPWRKREL